MPQLTTHITSLGSYVGNSVSRLGDAVLFIIRTLISAAKPPYNFDLLLAQIYAIGVQSVSVVALVGGFTGAVLAVQGEYTLAKFGATAYTGSAVALSLLRELGPVLTALMVNGRAGSAMTAELGIMKITEQVDALRSMAIDPLHHLIVPRILAGVISVPLLTAMFNVVGILGGYLVGVETLGLSSGTFISVMIDASTVDRCNVWISKINRIWLLRIVDRLLQRMDLWIWSGGREQSDNECCRYFLCYYPCIRLFSHFNFDTNFP